MKSNSVSEDTSFNTESQGSPKSIDDIFTNSRNKVHHHHNEIKSESKMVNTQLRIQGDLPYNSLIRKFTLIDQTLLTEDDLKVSIAIE